MSNPPILLSTRDLNVSRVFLIKGRNRKDTTGNVGERHKEFLEHEPQVLQVFRILSRFSILEHDGKTEKIAFA